MAGTVMSGPSASRSSRSSYSASPSASREPPAIVVDRDRDVIRILKGRRAASEGGVVEVPVRRGDPPDQLREVAPVLLVSGPDRARWRSRTGTTTAARLPAATAACRPPG